MRLPLHLPVAAMLSLGLVKSVPGPGFAAGPPSGRGHAPAIHPDSQVRRDEASGTLKPPLHRYGLGDGPYAAQLRPDLATYVSSGRTASALHDAVTGEVVRAFPGDPGGDGVNRSVLSPDGRLLLTHVTSPSEAVQLLDVDSGQLLMSFPDCRAPMGFHPDGLQVFVTHYYLPSGSVIASWTGRLYSMESGEIMSRYSLPWDGAHDCVAISPTGDHLITIGRSVNHPQTAGRLFEADNQFSVRSFSGSIHADFSPDGSRYITAEVDGSVRLWDTVTGAQIRRIPTQADEIRWVAYAPDGASFVSGGSDGAIHRWNPAGGLLTSYLAHAGAINTVEFSPDGARLISSAEDGKVMIWDATNVPSTAFATEFQIPGTIGNFPVYNHEQTLLAQGAEDGVRLYRAIDGGLEDFLPIGANHAVAFLRHSDAIVTYDYQRFVLRSLDDGAVIHSLSPFQTFPNPTTSDVSVDDSTLLALSSQGAGSTKVAVWSLVTGEQLWSVNEQGSPWIAAGLTHGDTVATLMKKDGTVERRAAVDGALLSSLQVGLPPMPEQLHEISCVPTPDGRTLALLLVRDQGTSTALHIVDLETRTTGDSIAAPRTYARPLKDQPLFGLNNTADDCIIFDTRTWTERHRFASSGIVRLSPSGRLAWEVTNYTSSPFTIRQIPLGPPPLGRLGGFVRPVRGLATDNAGGSILTGSVLGAVHEWSVDDGRLLRQVAQVAGDVQDLRLSSGGDDLLVAHDEVVDVLARATGSVVATLRGHTDPVSEVAASPVADLAATGSSDDTVRLWDLQTGASTRTLSGHTGPVNAVGFSPDGGTVISGSSDFTARLWNVATGQEAQLLLGHTRDVTAADMGAGVAATGARDATVRVWNPASGAQTGSFSASTADVASVALSPDGTLVAGGYDDGTLGVWERSTGETVWVVPAHLGSATTLAFMPDGERLVSAGEDGAILSWELRPPRAVIVAGGGAYAGNAIARQTSDLGAYAYRTLRARGYEPDEIQYLSAFPDGTTLNDGLPPVAWDLDGDGVDEVDGYASLEAVEDALAGPGAQEAGRLLVIMIDHGYVTSDFMVFRVNPTQVISTDRVNTLLNDLQSNHPVDVTLVVDCCYSGHFVEDCRKTDAIPAERDRIVIASTSKTAEAVFLPAPDLTSFLHTFLGSAYMGNSMGEAWRSGQRFFSRFPVANQRPVIDDGEVNTDDDATTTTRANREFFGASWAYGVQADKNINRFFPAFDTVEPQGTVGTEQAVILRAKLLPYQRPNSVYAAIRPPAPTVVSGEPITGLPRVQLSRVSDDLVAGEVWEADATDLFDAEGPYTISFTAAFDANRLSDPAVTDITVTDGPDPDPAAIRAILAIGEGSTPQLAAAFADAGSFAWKVYSNRFVELMPNGTVESRPEWIAFRSPYALKFADKKQLRRSEAFALEAHAKSRKAGEGAGPTPVGWGRTAGLFSSNDALSETSDEFQPAVDSPSTGVGQPPSAAKVQSGSLSMAGEGAGPTPVGWGRSADVFSSNGALSESATDFQPAVDSPSTVVGQPPSAAKLVAAPPTASEILSLLDNQDAGTERLFVHLIAESASGGALQLSGTESLSAADLDARLDAFQARPEAPEVILIVDAAGSGSFVPVCAATGDQRRVVMTSGRANDGALFLTAPSVSFTHKLCAAAWGGNDLWRAWDSTRSFYGRFLNAYSTSANRIRPQCDADGDGSTVEFLDNALPSTIHLGRRFAFAGDEASGLPFLLSGTESATAAPGAPVTVTLHLLEGIDPTADGVYVQLVPPGLDLTGSLTTLGRVPLVRTDPDAWTWAATFDAPSTEGDHTLVFQAEYADLGDVKLAEPLFGTLSVRSNNGLPGDVNGDGSLTPADADLAFRCWLEAACPSGADALLADYCADGAVTPQDAEGIFGAWLGIGAGCP